MALGPPGMKLWSTPQERETLETCADVYAIIKTCERLEKVRCASWTGVTVPRELPASH